MKIDIAQLEENDIVMVHHDIGNMLPEKIDEYLALVIQKLIPIFGEGRVYMFPVRGGPAWDFTIIRKPPVK